MIGAPLDLTPIVDDLVSHPFDRKALHRAQASVDGPLSYARALRTAAKRTGDCKAASFWFIEAARVHESLDDPGGAIALLTRAWDCDPGNERTRQLTAALLTRVAERVGLTFVAHASDPIASERRSDDRSRPRAKPISSSPSAAYHDPPDAETLARRETVTRTRRVMSRPTGDRLIGGLFEALHQLRFVEDIVSGAACVLQVVVEKTRSEVGLVHLYDVDNDEFVLVSAIGRRHQALLDWITPGNDRFVADLMRTGEAVVARQPQRDPRFTQGRWALAEPQRTVLCAPAARHGRALGLIEIADPADGSEFTDEDCNALNYVAGALSQFILDRRGVSSAIRVRPKRGWDPRSASNV